MGNRAVITAATINGAVDPNAIGIYLHNNGGHDSVTAFLTYCKFKGFREPSQDCYGWARLAQVIANYFEGGLSIGTDICSRLDCDNYDNGVYFIRNWEVVGRAYNRYEEQDNHSFRKMIHDINDHMPKHEQIERSELEQRIDKHLGWVNIYYEEICVGKVLTNNSLTVEEALQLFDFNEEAFLKEHNFDEIDYNEFKIK